MAKNWVIRAQLEKLQSLIIADLQELMKKNQITPLKIIPHEKNGAKFYQIHFDNNSNFLQMETLNDEMTKAGYSPKSFYSNLPESFYLIVMRVKPI